MAIGIEQLAAALRLGDGVTAPAEPVLSILARLAGVADAYVNLVGQDAPEAVRDEAIVRFTGYMFDAPPASSGDRYASAWQNSGAASLLSRWVQQRVAGATAVSTTEPTVGGGLTEAERARLLPSSADDGQIVVYHADSGLWVATDFTPGGTQDLVAPAAPSGGGPSYSFLGMLPDQGATLEPMWVATGMTGWTGATWLEVQAYEAYAANGARAWPLFRFDVSDLNARPATSAGSGRTNQTSISGERDGAIMGEDRIYLAHTNSGELLVAGQNLYRGRVYAVTLP